MSTKEYPSELIPSGTTTTRRCTRYQAVHGVQNETRGNGVMQPCGDSIEAPQILPPISISR